MKNFIVYVDSGKIIKTGSCSDNDFDLQADSGEFIIEGIAGQNQYIENGKIVDMPTKPSGEYEFNYSIKQWVFNTEIATMKALSQRNMLLAEGPDRISPLWWQSMTTEQQTAWSKYRQDLLDITQQPNYPNVIIWPIKPTEGA